MSKSLKRVSAFLEATGLPVDIKEMPQETRTAQQAAEAAGCELDQIAKSIVFQGKESSEIYIFVTAGGNQVDPKLAAGLAGEPLIRADANAVRAKTGFAIGGVSPVAHTSPVPIFFDSRLTEFDQIWGAAGTPRHIFAISPKNLLEILSVQPSDFTA